MPAESPFIAAPGLALSTEAGRYCIGHGSGGARYNPRPQFDPIARASRFGGKPAWPRSPSLAAAAFLCRAEYDEMPRALLAHFGRTVVALSTKSVAHVATCRIRNGYCRPECHMQSRSRI